MKLVVSNLPSPGDTQLLEGIPNSAPSKQWHVFKRTKSDQSRRKERTPKPMSDTIMSCKQREEEPQNLYVNDRVYQGPDTGSKMNFYFFYLQK